MFRLGFGVLLQNAKVVNHYARLGIPLDAAAAVSEAELKAAYRKRALECHPDVAPTNEDRVSYEVQFRHVAESYEVLCNPEARRELNKALRVGLKKADVVTSKTQRGSSSSFMSSWSSPTPSNRTRSRAAAGDAKQGTTTVAPSEEYNSVKQKLMRRRAEEVAIERELFRRYTDAQQMKRKGFLRRDADRVFTEAFDGKTWEQVLFDLEKERRMTSVGAANTSSSDSAAEKQESSTATHAGDGEFSRAATRAVANRLRSRIERCGSMQGVTNILMNDGPIARYVRAAMSRPDGTHMPFRPFPMPLSQDAPSNLTADVVVPNLSEGTVDASDIHEVIPRPRDKNNADIRVLQVARNFKNRKRLEASRHNLYNMGQLYSYQRPY